MTPGNEALYDKAMSLSKDLEDNFLELGKSLRRLQDHDPELFHQFVASANFGRRKAYYLVEVSRIFDPLTVPRAKLRKIGWTKLQLIGKHVTPNNLDALLHLAEECNAKELERLMRGEKPLGNARCVLMYFSPKQYDELEDALVQHGGVRRGRGVENKEVAMISIVRRLNKLDGQA